MQSLLQFKSRCALGTISAFLAVTCLGTGAVMAAGPKPDEDGIFYCNALNDGGDVTIDVSSNSCCYEETANDHGDTLTVCIKCDKYWYNCSEVSADGSSRPGISLPPASGGTINETKPGITTLRSRKLK